MRELMRWKPRLRVSRSLLTGMVSIALGVTGALLAGEYLENRASELEARFAVPEEPMVQVVVPKRPLKPGDIVAMEDLAVRALPASHTDTHSITDRTLDAALGQRVTFDVDAGRPLLWAHLQRAGIKTFSGRLPAGLRAMTVRVDEVNAISGFLQPADRIDLLLTHGSGQGQGTLPLIDNLPVIATGVQTLIDTDVRQDRRAFTTITIEVSPRDAQRITLAQQVGRLTAVLRNPTDADAIDRSSVTVAELIGSPIEPRMKKVHAVVKTEAPVEPAVSEALPLIEYIIGGT